MMTRQLRIGTVLLCLIWCLAACGQVITPAPMSTSETLGSLFADDTCAPPCWFGLTPGVSTAEDARTFFDTRDDIVRGPNWGPGAFGPGTAVYEGDEVNGRYDFDLQGTIERPDDHLYFASYLTIKDGVVHSIWLWMNSYITLQEVLDALETPNLIRMKAIDRNWTLNLIYSDTFMSVRLSADPNECSISHLGQDFWVSSVWYYSSNASLEPVTYGPSGSLQPALYAYAINERDVSLDVWEDWLTSSVNMSCEEAVEQLPAEVIYPTVMPTMMTMTPSMTETPTRVAP